MKKIKLLIEEEKVDVFLKFVKTLGYVKILDDGSFKETKSDSGEEKSKHSENQVKEPLKKFLRKV